MISMYYKMITAKTQITNVIIQIIPEATSLSLSPRVKERRTFKSFGIWHNKKQTNTLSHYVLRSHLHHYSTWSLWVALKSMGGLLIAQNCSPFEWLIFPLVLRMFIILFFGIIIMSWSNRIIELFCSFEAESNYTHTDPVPIFLSPMRFYSFIIQHPIFICLLLS